MCGAHTYVWGDTVSPIFFLHCAVFADPSHPDVAATGLGYTASVGVENEHRVAQAMRATGLDPSLLPPIVEALSRARAAWPDIPEQDELAAFVANRLSPASTGLEVARLHFEDLYLAHACMQGHASATVALEHLLRTSATPALRRLSMDAAAIDDLLQTVLIKLVIGPDAKLAGYMGRGSLRRWLRSFALRTGLKQRQRSRTNEDAALLDALPSSEGPEVAFLGARYRASIRHALMEGFRTLDVRERGLMRQHYLDGLTLAQLGGMHRVSRRTVARWLAQARVSLESAARAAAVADAGLSDTEFQSLIPLVWSQLRSGLRELLATADSPPS